MRPAPRPQLLAINPLPTLLAARLGLPWVNAIEKIRDNDPQKQQANSYHQCANPDGIFAVHNVRREPVLLIDDITDSGGSSPSPPLSSPSVAVRAGGRNHHAHRAHSGRLRHRHPAGQPAQSQHQLQMTHRSAKQATAAALALASRSRFYHRTRSDSQPPPLHPRRQRHRRPHRHKDSPSSVQENLNEPPHTSEGGWTGSGSFV